MRIHSTLIELNIATAHIDFLKQYYYLKVLYKELKPVMNDKEREQFKVLKEKIENSYSKILEARALKQVKIDRSVVLALDEFEEEMRDIIQKKNLGLPKKMDSRYALAGK